MDEHRLQGCHPVDGGHASIPGPRNGPGVRAEKAVETVGDRQHGQAIQPAPSFIPGQHVWRADIQPQARGGDHDLGQGRGVPPTPSQPRAAGGVGEGAGQGDGGSGQSGIGEG